jgi:hypothetical protein
MPARSNDALIEIHGNLFGLAAVIIDNHFDGADL